MSYQPKEWSSKTPITVDNLNHIEGGIAEAHSAIEETGSRVEQIANNQIPEEYLQESVNQFIEENEAGLATKTELSALNGQLSSEIANLSVKSIKESVTSENMFNPNDEDILVGSYIAPNGNVMVSSGSLSATGFIEVEVGETYSMGGDNIAYARMLCAYNEGKRVVESAGVDETLSTYTVPNNIKYIRVSYYNTDDTFRINKGDTLMNYEKYGSYFPIDVLDKEGIKNLLNESSCVPYLRKVGNLGSGDVWELEENNIKTEKVLCFFGKITSFSKLLLGHGKNNNYVAIDNTDLYVYNNGTLDGTYAHGLEISNNIQVSIIVKSEANYDAEIRVISNGLLFTKTVSNWLGNQGFIFAESNNSVLTDCVFTWTCRNYNADVFAFGDSYFGHASNNRWVYYLLTDGYNKCLLDGFGGRASAKALESLKNALKHGTPKYIFWALGMNDQESGAMNQTWLSCVEEVIELCKKSNIELILATIPNTPTMNNTFKNEYVKSSGYRFVDFAKCVGAESLGSNWFGDMLDSDKVHPSTTGATTLYYQVLCDFPEIMMK